MPLRASSGSFSGASTPLAAAAAPSATTAAGHARVHDGVRGEGGGARGYGGEVGDHSPRVLRAALRAGGGVVGGAHRAHDVEALLAVGTPVFVEGHLSFHLSFGRRTVGGIVPRGLRTLKNALAARKLILRSL